MRAVICPAYGPPSVVRLEDRPSPAIGPGEVLLRVHAATVSTADWRIRSMDIPRGFGLMSRAIFGFARPRQPILGGDAAGVVAQVGEGVTRVKPGDAVIAATDAAMGCHADEVRLGPKVPIAPKPEALGWDEAAALVFGGFTALHFLRAADALRPGCRVLVIGASGAVGSAALQIARAEGARVDAVSSAANADLVRGLGAETVIDHGTTDFAATGRQWDVVMDCVNATTHAHARASLAPGGRLVLVAADLPRTLAALLPGKGGHRVITGYAPASQADLDRLVALAAAGRFRPVIDSTYPPEEAAAAHARVQTGRKRGNVVLRFA